MKQRLSKDAASPTLIHSKNMPPKKKVEVPELDVVLEDQLHGVKRVRGKGQYDPKKKRLVYNAYFYSDEYSDATVDVGGKRRSTMYFSTKAPAGSDKTELPPAEWPSILEQHDERLVHIAIKKLRVAAIPRSSSSSTSIGND